MNYKSMVILPFLTEVKSRCCSPYVLVTIHLFGVCADRLMSYLFDNIQHIELTDCSFVPDNREFQMIENDKVIWEG